MRHILKLSRSLDTPIEHIAHSYTFFTFDPEIHCEAWLELNNKIFAHHPDQGNWVMADLENRMNEPWFDPSGFFLCIHNEIIVGFCWTKIHQDLVNADPVGELYVIGVDPQEHSKGIGKTVCTEGLIYLRDKGIKQAILYVDADNEAGKGLYTSLGFN
jgi:mycothiol synthase